MLDQNQNLDVLCVVHDKITDLIFKKHATKAGITCHSVAITLNESGKTYEDNPVINNIHDLELNPEKVGLILVESNYGHKGSETINEPLFNYLLKQFPSAEIVASSATPNSLVKALQHHPKIGIMSKGQGIEQTMKKITTEDALLAPGLEARVFDFKKLIELIKGVKQDLAPAQEKPKPMVTSFHETQNTPEEEGIEKLDTPRDLKDEEQTPTKKPRKHT